jgi:hypothetical protein
MLLVIWKTLLRGSRSSKFCAASASIWPQPVSMSISRVRRFRRALCSARQRWDAARYAEPEDPRRRDGHVVFLRCVRCSATPSALRFLHRLVHVVTHTQLDTYILDA